MTVQTPSTNAQKYSDKVSSSGGTGSPGWWIIPAEAESESAHTSSAQDRNLFMANSPVVEVVDAGGHAPAVNGHHTPPADPYLVLFRSLAAKEDYRALTDLCLERLMLARDVETSLRWTKDAAIVEALQGRYGDALTLLASASYAASKVVGPLRGRYENEFGLVLVEFGRPQLAIERFDRAIEQHGGDALACGQVWNNKAVALGELGETPKALRCVATSIELIGPTGDAVSLNETRETGRRILEKLGGFR